MTWGPETQSWEELRFTVTFLENRAGVTYEVSTEHEARGGSLAVPSYPENITARSPQAHRFTAPLSTPPPRVLPVLLVASKWAESG